MKRVWTEEQIQDIIYRYTELGQTIKTIRTDYKCRDTTISNFLKENGIVPVKGVTTNRLLRHDFFSKIETEEQAYFLGLLIADGSIALDKTRSPMIRLELVESDRSVLERFKEVLKLSSELRYDKRIDRANGTYVLSVRSKRMAEDLSKYGVVPNKTYLMSKIETDLVPDHLIKDLIRGYVDGDGSIYYSRERWHLSVTGHSYDFIQSVVNICFDILEEEPKGSITVYNGVHKYTFNSKRATKLIEALYGDANFFIERKYQKAQAAISDKDIV